MEQHDCVRTVSAADDAISEHQHCPVCKDLGQVVAGIQTAHMQLQMQAAQLSLLKMSDSIE